MKSIQKPHSCWNASRPSRLLWFAAATVAILLFPIAFAQAQNWQFSYDLSGNLVIRSAATLAAPNIVGQPQPQIVAPGEYCSFSVVLADPTQCTFHWLYYGTNLAAQTSDTLLLRNVTTNNQGPYSVIVTNSLGSVTSVVAQLYIDSKGSGMPDSWQLAYFGNLNQTASGDFDGDGISNLEEFLDDTNPTNRNSFRSRLTILSDGGLVAVSPAKVSYDLTNTVSLAATPIPPNSFFGWTGDLVTRSNPAALAMNTNKTVRAHFACASAPLGMVGWWRAENDAADVLGANSGALSNGVAFTAGQVGQAFLFNGTNQEVKIPASPTVNVGPGGGLTIEAWVKPANLVNQYPLVEWNDGATIGVHFWANVAFSGQGGPGCFYANIRDTSVADHYFFTPAGLLSTSVWNHVVLAYDRTSGVAKMFFNGFAVASVNLGVFVPLTSANLHLGYRPGSVSYAGLMDEVTLYNRALTPPEVLNIYLADAAGKCSNTPYITSPAQYPDAIAGAGYTQQVASVLGTLPVGYSLSAGTLPAGLTLLPSGLLSGVPVAPGSNVFALLATDAAGLSSEKVCGLRVLPAASPVMVPGLAAWWRAENNALDSAGTNHGVMTAGAGFAAGEVGQAFSFNGTSNYVQVGNNPGLNFSNSFSMEAWLFPTGPGSDPTTGGIILGKEYQYEVSRFADGTLRWAYANSSPGYNWVSSGFVAPLNQWSHVVVVYENGVVSTYANGVLVQTYNGSGTVGFTQQGQNDFRIGGRFAVSQFFQGRLDEVSVYNRALSADDAALLYNAGSAGKVTVGPYINTAARLPDGVVGQTYTQTITAIRGTAPISFGVTAGALPAGITLTSAGVLGGIPTNAGTFSFTVRATDAATLTADQTFTLQVFAPLPPPPGIVGWWRGEANALDSIGTNHGVLRNGAGFAVGKVGQAFSLDGISQSVDIADAPALRPASVTLETWAWFAGTGTRILLGKPVGPGTLDSYQIYLSGGTLGAYVSDVAGGGPNVSIPFSPAIGSWYHVAYTFDDASKQEALYLNGSQVATGFANKTIGYDTQPLLLGRDIENGNPNFFFAGRLDETAIYNRALGSNEIASLYTAGPGGKTITGPYFTNPPALPDGVLGAVYSQTLGTARGSGTVTFSLANGTLPPALSLTAAGLLSGTPSAGGTFSFTIRATDATPVPSDQSFTLRINSQPAPPAGIVAWWRGENNGLDAIGGNNAILINATTFAPGKVGQAFALSGANDALKIPDAPALHPVSFTLETWVMFSSANGLQILFAKPLGGGSLDSFAFSLDNGTLEGLIADYSGFVPPLSAPFTPVLGQWYHVAFTFDDASKQETIYLNGVAVNTSIAGKSIAYDFSPVELGRDIENGSPSYFLAGRMDETAIYNRALSALEIAALYNAGSAGKAIAGPYITTSPALPAGAVGQPYGQTFASARGTGQVSYSTSAGTLPPGLSLSSAGLLTGNPTGAGTFTFTVRATDSVTLFGEQVCTLNITGQIPPPAGIISWWRSEGDASDAIGANPGVLRNGVAFGAGMSGQAFVLDGIDTSIDVPDSPSLRPSSVTFESWVMFNAVGTRVVVGKPVGGGISDSYQIYLSGGNLGAFVGDAAGSGTGLSVPFSPVLGQWYHVAYTFNDLTRQQVLYLNGLDVASGLGSKAIGYDSQPLELGRDTDNGAPAWFLQGRLDEAAIYSRALSAGEIFSIYRAGAAGKTTVGPYFGTIPSLPDAVLSQSYTQTISAVRGTGPIGYALTAGALPPGLTLTTNGILSGTLSSAGLYSFTVRATDAAALSAEQTFTLQVFAPVHAPPGLSWWWRAENNALDSAGTNQGTMFNTTFATGKVGAAFNLNGTNAYVAISNSAWLNPTGPFSVEFWMKPSVQQFSPDGYWLVVDKSHGFADGTGWVLEGNPDGTFSVAYGKGGSSSPANFISASTPGSVRDDHWHHIAGVFTGTQLAIYLDGAAQTIVTATNLPAGNARDVEIGRSWGGGSPLRSYHGLADEISYYNRALSPGEVGSIYNAGPAGKTLSGVSIVLNAALQNGALVLSFGSTVGTSYTIQYNDSLSPGAWQPLTIITAGGTTARYTNSVAAPQQRFFRVLTPGP